jgi:uncharacterized protein YggE
MTLALIAVLFVFPLFMPPSTPAQFRGRAQVAQQQNTDSQNVENHIITISRSGEAYAKPDLGILIMSIQSVSPIADEAVADNATKSKDVETALAGLGFYPTAYQISSVMFGQGGGPGYPGQSDITAYTATQYIYVFFQAADLSDVANLTERSAAVIEALRKAGAVPANVGVGFGPMMAGPQGAMIIYTIKDPTEYEHQALRVAISRAKAAAQDIAAGLGVQITGIRDVQSGYLAGNVVPRAGSSPLTDLKYRFYTTKINELPIIANVTLQYDFK